MSFKQIKQLNYRLVLLGAIGCGKTSILNRFLLKKYSSQYNPTVEDLFNKEFDLECLELKVEFLDTSGSMQFPAMRRLSITTGDAFLLVYSIDDKASLEVLKTLVEEIREIRQADFATIPIVFAGNKIDLPQEKRQVDKLDASHYVHCELPRMRSKLIECSCKENINIDTIFKAYLILADVKVSNHSFGHKTALNVTSAGQYSFQRFRPLAFKDEVVHKKYSGSDPSSSPPLVQQIDIVGKPQQIISKSPFDFNKFVDPTSEKSLQQAEGDLKTDTNLFWQPRAKRTSSLRRKVALGVRKSCDGSIISSIKNTFVESFRHDKHYNQSNRTSLATSSLTSAQECINKSSEISSCNLQSKFAEIQISGVGEEDKANIFISNANENRKKSGINREDVDNDNLECRNVTVNLETAIRSHLNINTNVKPRSKSMIWRSTRRANREQEVAECLIS